MIESPPPHVPIVFGLATLATLLLFGLAVKKSDMDTTSRKTIAVLACLSLWLAIQAALTLSGLYSSYPAARPPKIFLFGILPALAVLAGLFLTKTGRRFADSLPLAYLTYLHVVRIPVEIGLYWLFLHGTIPQLMTFEGRNFDILAGLTAPAVAYFGLTKGKASRRAALIWNIACLGLLLNIVVIAFLSTPSPLQRLAFDQPNVAILHFPFSSLPTFIVPVVLLAHLASIRQLLKQT